MKIWLLLALFIFTFSNSVAANECKKFFPDGIKIIDGIKAYAISRDKLISFGCPKSSKIIAYDRFKGLCLFKGSSKKPFKLTKERKFLFFCSTKSQKRVKIQSYPSSIYPGRIKNRYKNGALFGDCCSLAGIVNSDGEWYDSSSILKLLKKDTYHGDVGVRFSYKKGRVLVNRVNPFIDTPLLPGDRIIGIDKIKYPSLDKVRDIVDNCKSGEKIFFKVVRKNRRYSFKLKCFKRVGGGMISDTFLENFGIWFNKKLIISKIDKNGEGFKCGLKIGDRLLKVDGKMVFSENGVQKILSSYSLKRSKPKTMLWERDNFQFFLLPSSI